MIKLFWSILTISVALLIFSFILYLGNVGENVRNSIIASKFRLWENNTEFFNSWLRPIGPDGNKIGSDYDFYLWNITNPTEILENGESPKLEEVGPFCYKNFNEHVNVSTANGTVFYKNRQTYVKRACSSPLTGQELIYHVNVPFILVMDQIRNSFYRGFVKGLFPSSWSLFVAHGADELIWSYPDPVLAKLKAFSKDITIDSFGYFLGQNGSDSMLYEVDDGSRNIKDLTKVKKWNNKKTLDPIWTTDLANMIRGTDGNNLPPLLEKDDRMYVFVDSMCRSIYFEAEEEPVKLGPIDTWKYTLPKEVFEGVQQNPANLGYCVNGVCNPGGVLNLTSCYNDTYNYVVPYLMSKPHLLDADQVFHDDLQGMNPKEEIHGTRLFAEPVTGFLLGAEKNLQVNIHLTPTILSEAGADQKTLKKYKNGLLIPAHWISQKFTASPEILDYLEKNVLNMFNLVLHFPLILLTVSLVGTLISFIIGVRIHLSDEKVEKSSEKTENSENSELIKA